MLKLDNIACVLADTTRSKAYMQILLTNGLQPAKCLVLTDCLEPSKDLQYDNRAWDGQYFDLNEPILYTLAKYAVDYDILPVKDINEAAVAEAVKQLAAGYIVYSGYGGAILQPHLFRLGKQWLHVHAGMLPAYRGSTTAYYSLLNNNKIGASAIFLNEQIDEGNVICAREFPPCKDGRLIDYIYEPYVRACVLLEALQGYVENGEFASLPQEAGAAETYFIIHPVLKHLAILGLTNEE